jgi:hypothetical protein
MQTNVHPKSSILTCDLSVRQAKEIILLSSAKNHIEFLPFLIANISYFILTHALELF